MAVIACLAILQVQGYRTIHANGGDLRYYTSAARVFVEGSFWKAPRTNTWPPFFSMFVAPLAWLEQLVPAQSSRNALVFGLNVVLALALLVLTPRALSGRRSSLLVHAIVFLCAAPYLRANFYFGQINLVPALAAFGAFALLERKRLPGLAGGLVGFAASLKVTPVFLLPYLRQRPRALLAALATGVVCALLPALVYGPVKLWEATRYWLSIIDLNRGAYLLHNISFAGMLHRFFDSRDGEVVKGFSTLVVDLGSRHCDRLGLLLGLGLLVGAYVLVHRAPRRPAVLDAALLLPIATLTSTIAWRHHFVVLLPALAALVLYLEHPSGEPPRRRRVAWLFGTALVLTVLLEVDGPFGHRLQALGLGTWAAVTTLAALAVMRLDRKTEAFASPSEEEPVRVAA